MRRWLMVALLLGCDRAAPEQVAGTKVSLPKAFAERRKGEEGKMGKESRPMRAAGLSGLKGDQLNEGFAMGAVGTAAPPAAAPAMKVASPAPAEEPAPAPTPRAWFPETFLFAPLVVTDGQGAATLPVRVPDRLTTWRVLALAHSRAGAQAGAETSFLGTLPTYVDPVVPSFLMVGDDVALPIQVVNTTDEPVTAPLRIQIDGAALSRQPGSVRLPPRGRSVTYAPVRASHPGQVTVRASIGDRDAVERSFPVRPTGKPLVETRRGTLAAPRTLEVILPQTLDPATASARLVVFPGALALLRAEVAGAGTRADGAGEAYALLLAGRGEELLRALGGEPAGKELRALGIVASQRVIRATRSPDALVAAVYIEPALAHPQNPILSRLAERLADTVAAGQRPDGTFGGATGWPLQRLLVASADCVRAVRLSSGSPVARQRAARVSVRARAAFERNLDRIEDPYTAAAVLAAGVLDGAPRDRLRKILRSSLHEEPDGARKVPATRGVVRSDGIPPSDAEASALAVLALRDDPTAAAVLPDLGASLLSAYDPERGFGDGRTNLLALAAVLSLFREPLPQQVTITLAQDGRPLGTRTLEGPKLREALAFEAPLSGAAGKHRYEIRAEPAVAGLAYSLALKGFTPWTRETGGGLELTIDSPKEARVGRPVDIGVRAAAPAGLAITIRHALPAGVQVDGASLDLLVSSGAIQSYRREDGAVVLEVPARAPGQTFSAHYRAIPTLAGTLTAGASSISVGGGGPNLPPIRWVIR
jgi:hypothetical protein